MTWQVMAVVGLVAIMIMAGRRGLGHLRLVWRAPDDLASSASLVRAIRALVLAACAGAFVAAILLPSRVALLVGGIILLEEIYETGVALLILRAEGTAPTTSP